MIHYVEVDIYHLECLKIKNLDYFDFSYPSIK